MTAGRSRLRCSARQRQLCRCPVFCRDDCCLGQERRTVQACWVSLCASCGMLLIKHQRLSAELLLCTVWLLRAPRAVLFARRKLQYCSDAALYSRLLQEAEQSMPDSASQSQDGRSPSSAGASAAAAASAAADASDRQHPQDTWQARADGDQSSEEHAACQAQPQPPQPDLQAAQTQCFVPEKAAAPPSAEQQPELPASSKQAKPGPPAGANPAAGSKLGVPGADSGGKPEAAVTVPSQEQYLGFKPPPKPQMQRGTALAAAEAARLVASTAVHASRVSLQIPAGPP